MLTAPRRFATILASIVALLTSTVSPAAEAAQKRSTADLSVPTARQSSHEPTDIPTGARVVVYGLADDGDRFDYTYVQKESSPPLGPSLPSLSWRGLSLLPPGTMR